MISKIEPPPPVTITPVKPAELHLHWPFIERGLSDIVRKIHPDWIPPDVYIALRADAATCCIVSRETPDWRDLGIPNRRLGFFIWHRQERPFSHILDIFVWATWAIPPRERIEGDNINDAIWQGRRYLLSLKQQFNANKVIMITSVKRASAFSRRYGFKQLFVTCEV